MGNYVKLTAKTRNGRERLQKYGDTWRVTQIDPEPSDCTGWTDWGWFMATPLGNSTQREFWISRNLRARKKTSSTNSI